MVPREIYDNSDYFAVTGKMGHLQTLFNQPVVPGTYSWDLVGALRLGKLKRFLTLDARVDLFAYFVSHRSVYGDDWVTMVKNGMQDATTLDVVSVKQQYSSIEYLGAIPKKAVFHDIPLAYPAGYNKIYNYDFRIANNTAEIAETAVPSDTNSGVSDPNWVKRKYGLTTARLPNSWNHGVKTANLTADTYAEVAASGGSGAINLLDFSRMQSEYRDSLDRDWFAHRYHEIMDFGFGSNGNVIDADERPELLMMNSAWLSGVEIDKNNDNAGEVSAKANGMVRLHVPPRKFNEHGMVWFLAVLRFPAILEEQCHYLSAHTWNYENVMGDPNVLRTKPPEEYILGDFIGDPSAATTPGNISTGSMPFGDWYRFGCSRVHSDYHTKEGFPFCNASLIGDETEIWYEDEAYGSGSRDFFDGEELGHWSVFGKYNCEARIPIPKSTESIYTGASTR